MARVTTSEPYRPPTYKRPRSINTVSVVLYAVLAAAIYGGWKFGPVYLQRFKVDSVLDDAANRSLKLRGKLTTDAQRVISSEVQAHVMRRLERLGLYPGKTDEGGHELRVRYGPRYRYIEAQYVVIVRHLFVKRTTRLEFHRKSALSGAWEDDD